MTYCSFCDNEISNEDHNYFAFGSPFKQDVTCCRKCWDEVHVEYLIKKAKKCGLKLEVKTNQLGL